MPLLRQNLPCAVVLFALLLASCAAQAPPGYEVFPTGYYKLHVEELNWGDAWDVCDSEGGHLAIINDDTEAFIMTGIFARDAPSEPFCNIGIHDLYKEGRWLTIWGTPLEETGYAKWQSGQPDNDGDEDCGTMAQGGLLNDADCGFPRPFLCEVELPSE